MGNTRGVLFWFSVEWETRGSFLRSGGLFPFPPFQGVQDEASSWINLLAVSRLVLVVFLLSLGLVLSNHTLTQLSKADGLLLNGIIRKSRSSPTLLLLRERVCRLRVSLPIVVVGSHFEYIRKKNSRKC